ncbi:hypothetical protein AJ79_10246 [Helicocarpus griseus UAMH5409]|uniref:SWIRM domain-containing protein n=1 Tax=Helicocarpus griseus UAMH5409 TaxID=1447875 RepID=A0A2B7WF34_9EURO|nr:hypothetical protein AJ79_10246 [Helicocarpus griseus UAMH5409]
MSRLPVSSLISPPEPKPLGSFNQSLSPCASQEPSFENNTLPPISADRKRTQSEMDLPSPPVTPNKKPKSSLEDQNDRDASTVSAKDPLLFAPNEAGVASDQPLFGPQLVPSSTAELVARHIESRRRIVKDERKIPALADYQTTIDCVPKVGTLYNRNPYAYYIQERHYLETTLSKCQRAGSQTAPKFQKIAPAPPKSAPAISKPRPKRTPKSTPKQRVHDSFGTATPTPKPARVIGTNRDDTDYRSLPDYCPPIETLRGNTKGLKADWKGQMLDLSNDPDRHELDPAEVGLAATLRLSCATYLCSKRRIFEARVNALHIGKEFRKTDAQQACKIDVNKASKLWTAYDRVGWFKPEYFRQYL